MLAFSERTSYEGRGLPLGRTTPASKRSNALFTFHWYTYIRLIRFALASASLNMYAIAFFARVSDLGSATTPFCVTKRTTPPVSVSHTVPRTVCSSALVPRERKRFVSV